jgi:hypothetical protein
MWLLLALLAALAAAIGYALWASKQRREALGRFARAGGWAFVPDDAPGYAEPFARAGHMLFRAGHGGTASDLLRGTFGGRAVEVLAYRYAVGPPHHSTAHHQTVVHVEDPALRLPPFTIRPAAAVHRLFGTQGFVDAALLRHREALTARTYLYSPHPEALRALATAPLADLFEADPALSVDGGGTHLFVFRLGEVAKVEDLPALLAQADAVARTLAATAPAAPPPPSVPRPRSA